jgi:hypothetical protein
MFIRARGRTLRSRVLALIAQHDFDHVLVGVLVVELVAGNVVLIGSSSCGGKVVLIKLVLTDICLDEVSVGQLRLRV